MSFIEPLQARLSVRIGPVRSYKLTDEASVPWSPIFMPRVSASIFTTADPISVNGT
jgi:hypothetical protein